jgi:hypothetical protein
VAFLYRKGAKIMKYFKLIRNRNVVDLLHYDQSPTYVKFQTVHAIPIRCGLRDAQGVLSDSGKIYNTSSFLPFPVPDMYPTVTMEEITENEYEILKDREFKSAEEIYADVVSELIERGIL